MIYIFIMVMLALLFFVKRIYRAKVYILLMLVTLFLSDFSLMMYLAKQNYYYNVYNQYFNITKSLWITLMMMPIKLETVVRLLNFSTTAFIFSSIAFAASFAAGPKEHGKFTGYCFLLLLPLLQLCMYDPAIYEVLYRFLYPDILDVYTLLHAQKIVHMVMQGVNFLYLLVGVYLILRKTYREKNIRMIRPYNILILLCYSVVNAYYFLIMSWAPAFLVKVSKVANVTRFLTIPLFPDTFAYRVYPFFLLLSSLVILLAFFLYLKKERSLSSRELVINRTFNTSTNMTRVFCHYIKNEVLAIMADAEYLDTLTKTDQDYPATVSNIQKRCQRIYERIDYVNRNINHVALTLKRDSLNEALSEIVSHLSVDQQIHIEMALSVQDPVVMLDRHYFTEAVENILTNSVEELNALTEKNDKRIRISTSVGAAWVATIISDNGRGMPNGKLGNLFTPFYSTKPVKSNWGLGLAISYNIIRAHAGFIQADSKEGEGMTFYIYLPIR